MKVKLVPFWGAIIFLIFWASCVIFIPYEENPREGREYDRPAREETYDRLETSYVYDYLSDYGWWFYLSPYGHVWVPRQVPYGWRPYTHGRWVWTSAGWLWVSHFKWGWLTFHYGRWGWNPRIGWFWVPGTIWAPAWVVWSWGGLYVGWAPVPPEIAWVPGVGFTVAYLEPPDHFWVFIEGRYFLTNYIERYLLPVERNRTVLNFTVNKRSLAHRGTMIVNEGIEPSVVGRWTKTEVKKYEIRETASPGREVVGRESVAIARPTLIHNELAKPRQILDLEKDQEKVLRERQVTLDEERLKLERYAMERSQREEENYLRQKMREEKAKTPDPSGQKEVEKRYEVQLEKLKKQHQEEKQALEKRQEEEKKKITGQPVKKKEKD